MVDVDACCFEDFFDLCAEEVEEQREEEEEGHDEG